MVDDPFKKNDHGNKTTSMTLKKVQALRAEYLDKLHKIKREL